MYSVFLVPVISWIISESFSLTLSSTLVALAILLYRGIWYTPIANTLTASLVRPGKGNQLA